MIKKSMECMFRNAGLPASEGGSFSDVFAGISKVFPEDTEQYGIVKEMYLYGTEEVHLGIEAFSENAMSPEERVVLRKTFCNGEKIMQVAEVVATRKELRRKMRRFKDLSWVERMKVLSSLLTRSLINDEEEEKASLLTQAITGAIYFGLYRRQQLPDLLVAALSFEIGQKEQG